MISAMTSELQHPHVQLHLQQLALPRLLHTLQGQDMVGPQILPGESVLVPHADLGML